MEHVQIHYSQQTGHSSNWHGWTDARELAITMVTGAHSAWRPVGDVSDFLSKDIVAISRLYFFPKQPVQYLLPKKTITIPKRALLQSASWRRVVG